MVSNNTLIIALTQGYVNNLNLLKPKFTGVNDTQYIIHNSPIYEIVHNKETSEIVTNFDYHIEFPYEYKPVANYLLSKMYIQFPYRDKLTQYSLYLNFKNITNSKLKMPKVYYKYASNNMSRVYDHGLNTTGTPDCDKVVIKPNRGARGTNHILLPTNMLSSVLRRTDKSLEELVEEFPDLIISEGSNMNLMLLEDPDDYIVTEYLSNIKAEYRLLVSGEDIYVRERNIHGGEYPQGCITKGAKANIPTVSYTQIRMTLPKDVCDELQELIKYIRLPVGSIDLFETNDGDWGIFEFSYQFAHHGADANWICQLQRYAIDHIISHKEDYIIV